MSWRLEELAHGGTLVTVNNRLATELQRRYDRGQSGLGRPAWPSADILPWHAWLQRQYERLVDHGLITLDLLTPAQERLIWEEIIGEQTRTHPLLRAPAAAELAQSAFALVNDWQLDSGRLHAAAGDDARAYLAWQRAFEERLQRDGLLSSAQLAGHITAAIGTGRMAAPAIFVIAGFDVITPGQQALFDSLQRNDSRFGEYRRQPRQGRRMRVAAEDEETETRLAAAWALARLRDQADLRIGIVAPQIARRRQSLQRIFSEVVTTDDYLTDRCVSALFNLSLGLPLQDHPIVRHATLALQLIHGPRPLDEIGLLLRSPFVGGHDREWESRALFDVMLREQGMPALTLHQLLARLRQVDSEDVRHCGELLAGLERVEALIRHWRRHNSPSTWSVHFREILALLGWPGDDSPDSDEFQQLERLSRLFGEMSAMDKIRERLSLGDALRLFLSLLRHTIFQARTPPAPIQILGPLEAADLEFDAVWLLGMDDRHWPAAPQAHPFIPFQIQREFDMPHASAERELRFATVLTERLAGNSGTIVASHCVQSELGESRPSPLIANWPERPISATARLEDMMPLASEQDTIDWEAYPVPSATPDPIAAQGGAGLLAAQARCPFSAVARYRLDARSLPVASHHIDAAMAGTLVHELLHRVWQTLGNSRRLATMDDSGVEALITALAEATLEDLGRRRPDLFTPAFRRIESHRLTSLVSEWLACERQRGQDYEVIALERSDTVSIAGLQLKTRADRIDRLDDGSLVIIDYKTGRQVRTEGWFDDRLSEPQLPLYCLGPGQDQVRTAALARVRRGPTGKGCGFVGVSAVEGFAPGVSTPESDYPDTDWSRLLAHWRDAIEQLGVEIRQGRCDPTPSMEACRYCELGTFCRVDQHCAEGDDD